MPGVREGVAGCRLTMANSKFKIQEVERKCCMTGYPQKYLKTMRQPPGKLAFVHRNAVGRGLSESKWLRVNTVEHSVYRLLAHLSCSHEMKVSPEISMKTKGDEKLRGEVQLPLRHCGPNTSNFGLGKGHCDCRLLSPALQT